MIIIVDDDKVLLTILENVLISASYKVKTFSSAADVLEFLNLEKPELIISDIVMPNMNGFQLKSKISEKFGQNRIPFIFLSSHSDSDTVVKGLDLGADDYIVKPIIPEIIVAKVKALLRRVNSTPTPTFVGDLSKLSFFKIFQFCESKSLSGYVIIESGEITAKIRFKNGEIDFQKLENGDELIDRLSELTTGTFKILQDITKFDEISDAAVVESKTQFSFPKEKPMGQLSGVKAGDKLFQVQTEFAYSPIPSVVTIVVYNGKTVLKRVDDNITDSNKETLDRIIRTQHKSVEAEVEEKLSSIKEKKPSKEEELKSEYTALYDIGLDNYMAKNYKDALDYWEKASALNPDNKALNINLALLRKKLNKQ